MIPYFFQIQNIAADYITWYKRNLKIWKKTDNFSKEYFLVRLEHT